MGTKSECFYKMKKRTGGESSIDRSYDGIIMIVLS